MVVDKYCQIVERETGTISVLWKASHMLCLLTATLCSLLTVCDQVFVIDTFGQGCVLYANLTFTDVNAYETAGNIPENLSFYNTRTIWGKETVCSYTKASYLFSMIIAMIMLAFIIVLPKGGYSDNAFFNEGWTFVPWGISSSVIIMIFLGIAYRFLRKGMEIFLDQLYGQLIETGKCVDPDDCYQHINIYTLVFHETEVNIVSSISMMKVTSVASLVAWVVLIVTLFMRIIFGVDFVVVVYNISPVIRDLADSDSTVSSDSYFADDARIQPSKKLAHAQIHGKKVSAESETEETEDFELAMSNYISNPQFSDPEPETRASQGV